MFKQVLADSGVGPLGAVSTGKDRRRHRFFVLAAAVRIIQGFRDCGVFNRAGLVMPVIEQLNFSGRAEMARSLSVSPVQLWFLMLTTRRLRLLGKFTGATEAQTLKTSTMMEITSAWWSARLSG